jgi:hypothetical protein
MDITAAMNEDGVDAAQASRLWFVHQHHEVIEREILQVLRNHPLDPSQELRTASEVIVVIEVGEVGCRPPSPVIDSTAWPRLVLKLPNDDSVVKNLHAILCHEFAHAVDRLDPEFGLSLDAVVPRKVLTLWNYSIDERLARNGVRVPHLVEEQIDPRVASAVAACERPAYAWLVELAGSGPIDNNNP